MMQRLIYIQWQSFLVAGGGQYPLCHPDPIEIMYHSEPLIENRIGAYTAGFFVF